MASPIFTALNVLCEIYNRPALSELAAAGYIKACGVSEEVLMQRLVDWLRKSPNFPLPCDLME